MAIEVNLETRKNIIKSQKVFLNLTDEEVTELASQLEVNQLQKGQVIVKEGDPVDSLYFIVSGEADVATTTHNEGVATTASVATLIAGKAIGLSETGFYSLTGLRTATVVANTDVVLLRISIPRFNGFKLAHANAHF